jgi:hypothetical protein
MAVGRTNAMSEREDTRANLLPEEERAGSDDPQAQAEQVLADSDERSADRNAAPDTVLEHRSSDETL